MDEIEKVKNERERQKTKYRELVSECHLELERIAINVERIEIDRKFIGDWEANRQLQRIARSQVSLVCKIRAYREEITFIDRGVRDFGLFTGM